MRPTVLATLLLLCADQALAAPPIAPAAPKTSRFLKPFVAIGQRFRERRAFNHDVKQARRGSAEVQKAYKGTLKRGLKWTSPILAVGGSATVGGGAVATHCASMLAGATPLQVLLAGPSLIMTGYLATAVAVPGAAYVGVTISGVRREARLDAYGAALGQAQVRPSLSADGMRHYRRFLVKEQRSSSRALDRLTGKRNPNPTRIAKERAYLQDLGRQLAQIDGALAH